MEHENGRMTIIEDRTPDTGEVMSVETAQLIAIHHIAKAFSLITDAKFGSEGDGAVVKALAELGAARAWVMRIQMLEKTRPNISYGERIEEGLKKLGRLERIIIEIDVEIHRLRRGGYSEKWYKVERLFKGLMRMKKAGELDRALFIAGELHGELFGSEAIPAPMIVPPQSDRGAYDPSVGAAPSPVRTSLDRCVICHKSLDPEFPARRCSKCRVLFHESCAFEASECPRCQCEITVPVLALPSEPVKKSVECPNCGRKLADAPGDQ